MRFLHIRNCFAVAGTSSQWTTSAESPSKLSGGYRADVLGLRVVLPKDLEALKERVIGCAIAVHRELGPGLLESIYQACLTIELREAGLSVEREIPVPVIYRGQSVGNALKIDLIVEGRLVVEVKAVERIHPVYIAQLITYLKLTGFPAGLLMNFNSTSLRAGLRTAVHPELYRQLTPTLDDVKKFTIAPDLLALL